MLGGKTLLYRVLIGGVFMNDGELTFSSWYEDPVRRGFKRCAIWIFADWYGCDDGSGIAVYDNEFVSAGGKKPVVLPINGEPGRTFVGSERPGGQKF